MACARSDSVAVFDLDSREVVTQVPVGREPIGLVHDREGGRVFSTDARSDVVSVIDTKTLKVVKQIPVQHYPAGAGFYPERRKMYVGNTADNTVSVIDADRLEVIATVPAKWPREPRGGPGAGPRLLRQLRRRLHDGDRREDQRADRRDQARLRAVQDRGGRPRGRAYIANSLVSTVAVVDLDQQEVVDTLTVERAPVGMGLGRRGDRIYAANRGTGR